MYTLNILDKCIFSVQYIIVSRGLFNNPNCSHCSLIRNLEALLDTHDYFRYSVL